MPDEPLQPEAPEQALDPADVDPDDDLAEWMTLPPPQPPAPPGTLSYEPASSNDRRRAVRGRQLAVASLVLGLLVSGYVIAFAAVNYLGEKLPDDALAVPLAPAVLATLSAARMADRRLGPSRLTLAARLAAVGWLPPAIVVYVVDAPFPLAAVRNAAIFVMIAVTLCFAMLMFLDSIFGEE